MKQGWRGLLLVAPALALFLLMGAGPFLYGIGMAFFKVTVAETRFVGWDNFTALGRDPGFWQALRNTGLYVAIIVPVVEALGLGVAVAAQSLAGRAKSGVRAIIYLSNRVAGVALLGSWMWLWVYDGLINRALGLEMNWYARPTTAFALVCATALAWNYGGRFIIYLAGLDGQPKEVLEAARLDGADAWMHFWRIRFPMLRRLMLYQFILSVIGIAQIWEVVLLFTSGGPNGDTTSLAYYLWGAARMRGQYGLAGAVGLIEMIIILALVGVQARIWRER